jgi:hypothetical protein
MGRRRRRVSFRPRARVRRRLPASRIRAGGALANPQNRLSIPRGGDDPLSPNQGRR